MLCSDIVKIEKPSRSIPRLPNETFPMGDVEGFQPADIVIKIHAVGYRLPRQSIAGIKMLPRQ